MLQHGGGTYVSAALHIMKKLSHRIPSETQPRVYSNISAVNHMRKKQQCLAAPPDALRVCPPTCDSTRKATSLPPTQGDIIVNSTHVGSGLFFTS